MSELNYDPAIFHYSLESVDLDRHIIATYSMEETLEGEKFLDHLSLVQEIAIEGSTGSWEKLKEETKEIRRKFTSKVVGYFPVSSEASVKRAVVQLAIPCESIEPAVASILLVVAGNCFAFSPSIRLLDIFVPASLANQFRGPKFGVSGIRERLGVSSRPLLLQVIKPRIGLTPKEIAEQVYQTAVGGADMVKDDEMCVDIPGCTFEDRLKAVLDVLEKAHSQTGRRLLYLLNITDDAPRVLEKALTAMELGANGFLLAYSAGLSALKALAEHSRLTVPIMLHTSHFFTLLPRFSYPALAKLARLCGADMLLTPPYWSGAKMAPSLEESLRTVHTLLGDFHNLRRTFPVPGAAVHPGYVPTLLADFGTDIVIPSGGGILGHPLGYSAGAKAWLQAIEASMQGIPLEDYARTHQELKFALDKWGIFQRPTTPWLRPPL